METGFFYQQPMTYQVLHHAKGAGHGLVFHAVHGVVEGLVDVNMDLTDTPLP